jgi:hypothetical protein
MESRRASRRERGVLHLPKKALLGVTVASLLTGKLPDDNGLVYQMRKGVQPSLLLVHFAAS